MKYMIGKIIDKLIWWYEKFNPYKYFTDLDKVEIKNPIFLLGLQNGGLTLIARILHKNKQVVYCTGNYKRWAGRDELHEVYHEELPECLKSPYGVKYLNLEDVNGLYACNDLLDKFRCTKNDVKEEDRIKFKRILASIIVKYGRGISNPRFVDKSQTYTLKVEYLNELLKEEQPYFLLVLRNPYAWCKRAVMKMENYKKLQLDYESKLRLACEHYANSINIALKDGKKVDNFKVIKFEDFVRYPEEMTKDICDFLNLEYNVKMLPQPNDKFHFGAVSKEKWYPIKKDVNSSYLKKLTERDIDMIEEYCGDIIAKFGYDTNW